ncbi:hypothetical protein OG373_33325 [Streptomyces avidinii]|uniref:hypothetical protein n=1 Tax=Streptomyces avidinii TaxID=1895 RepID=UPI00386F3070|nr:hypothetical protein OG373_33325 [Streptomyces avidinii]
MLRTRGRAPVSGPQSARPLSQHLALAASLMFGIGCAAAVTRFVQRVSTLRTNRRADSLRTAIR